MPMFQNTMPEGGDELLQALQKCCQIATTGAVGPTTPTMFTSTAPADGDDVVTAARKLNQALHINGGL